MENWFGGPTGLGVKLVWGQIGLGEKNVGSFLSGAAFCQGSFALGGFLTGSLFFGRVYPCVFFCGGLLTGYHIQHVKKPSNPYHYKTAYESPLL